MPVFTLNGQPHLNKPKKHQPHELKHSVSTKASHDGHGITILKFFLVSLLVFQHS